MLDYLQKTAWIALLACLAIVGGFEVYRASNHPKNQQPPWQQRSENPPHNKGHSRERNKTASILEIECDPNCAAKEPEEKRDQGYITRVFYKFAYDPVAMMTGLLGVATATLALIVLCQMRDFRKISKSQNRAYLWPGFAPPRFKVENGVRFYISILNTGQTAGILREIYHALATDADYAAGQFKYTKVDGRGEVIPPMRRNEEIHSAAFSEIGTQPMISCGYIVYTDVYRNRHEQAWKHRLYPTNQSEPLSGCYGDPPDKRGH